MESCLYAQTVKKKIMFWSLKSVTSCIVQSGWMTVSLSTLEREGGKILSRDLVSERCELGAFVFYV